MRFTTVISTSILAFCQLGAGQIVDVAIIGGGLSGLAAAKDLVAAGKSVIVLEARNRTGGRVLNQKLNNGGVTEVGAEFVGPTQDRVIALADSLGLTRYDTYNNGSYILWENSTITPYDLGGPTGAAPPVDYDSLVQVATAQYMLDTWASEIDVNAPWDHPSALEWDSQTLSSWFDTIVTLAPARFVMDVATTSIFSAEASELSMLYAIAYVAAAGNETNPGTLERLTETANGGQAQRINGGTQLIATKLAAKLGSSRVLLNAPVRKVQKVGSKYVVWADTAVVTASKVVVAMSPPLAARIIYDPILPPSRDQLTQRMHMGSLGKAVAIYSTPFWRANGLSGQVVSDAGIIRSTYDSSPDDASYGAMMGFIEADQMRAFEAKSDAEVTAAVIEAYVNYFGPQAKNYTQMVIQRWDSEEWSRGAPVAYAPPRVLTQYGKALRAPVGGIHFAGTETSDYWVGYMDGAVRSGERVAKEILAGL
jgi:monoamine oxidase